MNFLFIIISFLFSELVLASDVPVEESIPMDMTVLKPVPQKIKVYDDNTMSVMQLTECVELKRQIHQSEQYLKKRLLQFNQHLEIVNQSENALKTSRAAMVDRKMEQYYTQAQADAYNAKVQAYNSAVRKFNRELDIHNNMERSYNMDVNSVAEMTNQYQVSCAGKKYYEDDLAEVVSEGRLK